MSSNSTKSEYVLGLKTKNTEKNIVRFVWKNYHTRRWNDAQMLYSAVQLYVDDKLLSPTEPYVNEYIKQKIYILHTLCFV